MQNQSQWLQHNIKKNTIYTHINYKTSETKLSTILGFNTLISTLEFKKGQRHYNPKNLNLSNVKSNLCIIFFAISQICIVYQLKK